MEDGPNFGTWEVRANGGRGAPAPAGSAGAGPGWGSGRGAVGGGEAEVIEDGVEFLESGGLEGADAVEGWAIGRGGASADHDFDLGGEEASEQFEFGAEVGVVVGVDDAEGDGADLVFDGGSGDFGGWEAGAEVEDAPAEVSGEGADHDRSEFVELAGGGGDDEFRGVVGEGERSGGGGEKGADDSGGEVFLGGSDFAAAPEFAEGAGERGEEEVEDTLGAEGEGRPAEGGFERGGVEVAHGLEAFLEPAVGGGFGCGGGGGRGLGLAEEFAELVDGEGGDLPDAVTGLGGVAEESEVFDIGFRVEAAVGGGAGGGDGGVAAFPDADDVGGEPGATADTADGVIHKNSIG